MIAILVPLYRRDKEIPNLIKSWKENNAGMSELLFAIESDDPNKEALKAAVVGFQVVEGKWDGVCEKLEDMYQVFKNDKYSVYHASADDITYSKDFDKLILEEVRYASHYAGHRCWVLYGNDMVHGQGLCTHWFATKEYIEAVGYFCPRGYMKHCNTDVTFYISAHQLGILRYVPWVITHHHSWANNERPKDESYNEVYNIDRLKFDNSKFELWKQEQMPKNLDNIFNSMRGQYERTTSTR